ncbi:hypothetical protein ACINK0_03080 [Deinococcus sp. VB343]|uniref:Uncharacterized protein n=1 Tax=Deinococcus sp. VB142 TaxID=3112952 RepID=A0AAU6PZT7_9DEIO
MTAPVTLPSPDRMNTGPYQVTVVHTTRVPDALGIPWAVLFGDDPRLRDVPDTLQLKARGSVLEAAVSIPGTVTPDGSLSVEPEPWAARHYRRAVMRGAGVYRWGLWAMLAPGRAAAEPDAQAGAALNGAAQLDGFTAWGYGPPLPELAPSSPPRAARPEKLPRKKKKQHKKAEAAREHKALQLHVAQVLDSLGFTRAHEVLTEEYGLERSHYLITLAALRVHKHVEIFSEVQAAANTAAALILPSGKEHRAQRRAFWAAVRGIVRVLRRMLPRVRRPRSTRPAPRPLYARPRPPAAPLAPPALA